MTAYAITRSPFDGSITLIRLLPGLNTGEPGKPCPNCKSETSKHERWCAHYLRQQQESL